MEASKGVSPTTNSQSPIPAKISFIKKLLSKVDTKTRIESLNILGFDKINTGKEKQVTLPLQKRQIQTNR